MPPYVLTVRAAFRGAASRLLALGRQVLETDVVDAAGTFIQSWAQTLAVGNVSGGTSPEVSNGDHLSMPDANGNATTGNLRVGVVWVLEGLTAALANQRILGWDGNITFIDSAAGGIFLERLGTLILRIRGTTIEVHVPSLEWETGTNPRIFQNGTAGSPFEIQAQDGGGGLAGGDLSLLGGDSAAGNGGRAILRGGTGTGTPGTAEIQHDDGALAVWVEDNGSAHTGGHAIHIGRNGLAFFDGTLADKPAVVGGKGGNPALTSLCSVLASMGLITDNTT